MATMSSPPHPIPYQGSKRKLAPVIAPHVPPDVRRFFEPFAGSAAMTLYAARQGLAERFVLGDSLEPMAHLLRAIVEAPDATAARYAELWRQGDFMAVRERFNAGRDPVDLLYLICRCVKNAVRFNRAGGFTQSADRRRKGMAPEKMAAAIAGASALLKGRTEFRVGDWRETCAGAGPGDFVYLDPPYLGTSLGRDKRYHSQLAQEALVAGLEDLNLRGVPFALSYDGRTGEKEYGPPLPGRLGLTRLLLPAGLSSQATLSGRREETVESLYLSPKKEQAADRSAA